MNTVISVENLSKKYIIRHEKEAGYGTLRDQVAGTAKQLSRFIFRPGERRNRPHKKEEFWALSDISFQIRQGERVGIIGRNGAGKSTLLKILSRITEPTAGRVSIKGRISSLLEVGTGFHAELTGRENIYLNGAILGMTRAEINRKFDEIVAFSEVEKFLDTPVKRYSSGMSVRLAFAVAAHLEPEILLVDEVLAVGDTQFQKKCLGKMDDVSKRGRTIFFVSHNMAAIQVLCSQVIRLEEGHIVGRGDVVEQVELYLRSVQCGSVNEHGSVFLGPDLELRSFTFSPNPVESGRDLEYEIAFKTEKPFVLNELAMQIYTAAGMRVAQIDFRRQGLPFTFEDTLTLKGRILKIPFVEGTYHVGLFVIYEQTGGDFYNLSEFQVINSSDQFDFVPYPAASRGVVELDVFPAE